MMTPAVLPLIPERDEPLDAAAFAAIREAGQPVVLRGLAHDWPLVAAHREGGAEGTVRYLLRGGRLIQVAAIAAPPSEGGRFFYNKEMTGFNFVRANGRLDLFLADLMQAARQTAPPAMAVQSTILSEIDPTFAVDNPMPLLPDVAPRIWIGNRIRVAPHYDVKENVAVCVAGRRRFTLFPPDQMANMYPGPLDLTPAGTPVSMIDPLHPDFVAFPRYRDAMAAASQATLDPGDAIYIPYCWWHGVESLDAVSALVNYWWTDGVPEGAAKTYDAMLHAMSAIRHLPPSQQAVWRDMFEYYVFADPPSGAHIPVHARGMEAPASPELFAKMRAIIHHQLRAADQAQR